MSTISQNEKIAAEVHSVLENGKARWKCQAISLTCHDEGYLVEPWQAERYTTVRTLRRLMRKRPNFGNRFKEEWTYYVQEMKGKNGKLSCHFRLWFKRWKK